MPLLTLILSFSFSPPSFAKLEDFVCPESFVCPPDIMGEVEFWTIRYGELDNTQMMVWDERYKNIYSIYQCNGNCLDDPSRLDERARIDALVLSVTAKVKTKNLDFTPEEQKIYDSMMSVKDYKFYDYKWGEKVLKPAVSFVVHEFGRKQHIRAGLPIYKRYKDHIVASLDRYGLPLAIQYLPFAESEYNPYAESVVKKKPGAAGIWQLMKDVAQKHGLTVDQYVWNKKGKIVGWPLIDERNDPMLATEVAMKYYQESMIDLDLTACEVDPNYNSNCIGPLLMLSYIYGPRIKNAVTQLKTPDFMTIRKEYKGAEFGPQTKGYLSKFLGVYYVATHEEKYFGEIVEPLQTPETKVYALKAKTEPAPLAQDLSLEMEELKYLPVNLRYSRHVWEGRKSFATNSSIEVPTYVDETALGTYVNIPEPKVQPLQRIQPRTVKFIDPAMRTPSKTIRFNTDDK